MLKTYFEFLSKQNQAYIDSIKLYSFYNSIYVKSFYDVLIEEKYKAYDDYLYEKWLKKTDNEFDKTLRTKDFTSLLSKYFNSLVDLSSIYRKIGYPIEYLNWLVDFSVERIASLAFLATDNYPYQTSRNIIYTRQKTRLLHYFNNDKAKIDKTTEQGIIPVSKIPILIVYAPINRFHILDLTQNSSVIRKLLDKGLDVYLLDWGHPNNNEDHLSLGNYINYIDEAVSYILSATNSADKVNLIGYCWGGIFSLIYTALNNNKIKNLTLIATPVDFSKDKTILASWSKSIDSDKIIEELGQMEGRILDLIFMLRNPPRYTFDKYWKMLNKLYDKEFMNTFIAVEKWLYNTPPIPGKLYLQMINDCYRNNNLISNTMKLDNRIIDLSRVDVPLLTVIAERDDLASPESCLAVNDYVSSKDKKTLRFNGGHVGLCISSKTHKTLWPEIAEWILSR
jgi:polyhydroxyalkanoate synthase